MKEIVVGEGVKFERIRRITGYLVGSVERFNNAKQAEVRERVKHTRMIPASEQPTSDEGSYVQIHCREHEYRDPSD